MYKVVRLFTDLQDDNHLYNVGDCYPRDGLKVSEERIKELSSDKNLLNAPLIVKEQAKKQEKPIENDEIVEIPVEKKAEKKQVKTKKK